LSLAPQAVQFHEDEIITYSCRHQVFCASLAAQITIKEKVVAVKKSGVVMPPYSVSLYRLEIR
jgi:hypothetical protein